MCDISYKTSRDEPEPTFHLPNLRFFWYRVLQGHHTPMQVSFASPLTRSTKKIVHPNMALIPGGEFRMGSHTGSEAERPIHSVYLDEFYIDTRLVSNADFGEFVGETGYLTTAEASSRPTSTWRTFNTGDRQDHPVVMISWYDADAYALWRGGFLPTEAQWERSARADGQGDVFPWGNQHPRSELTNWMRAGSLGEPPPTAPVSASKPNAFGLHDMAGNVWQWCADWYGYDYYSLSSARNPYGPESGEHRVRRGGAWNVREAFRLRCANRGAMSPDSFWPNLGFRCAASAAQE